MLCAARLKIYLRARTFHRLGRAESAAERAESAAGTDRIAATKTDRTRFTFGTGRGAASAT